MVKNKNFGFWNKMYSLFNVMAKASEFNKTLSHYRISFSNSKGNNLIYDSETDTIIDGDSEEEEEEQDEEKKEEQQEEDEKEKEKEDEKEDEKEKEDKKGDTDSTRPNDSSNFISYSSLFFLALLLLI